MRISMIFSIVGSILFAVVLFIFAEPLVGIFNKEADLEVLRLGILCARLQCVTLVIHSMESVICMFYAGTGKARLSLLMATARQGYCFIPVVLIVPFLFGAEGVAACQACADFLMLAVAFPLGIKAFRIIKQAEVCSDV